MAQRLGSVSPSPRTVKSDPLRFLEERCFDFGDSPSSAQRRWTLSHTSGAVKFPPLSSAAARSLDFVQVHGSETLGHPWRNEERIYHTPLGLSNPCPRVLTILRHFGFVRCSPVRGATRREFTTPRSGCQIHAIMHLRSCGISVLSGARPVHSATRADYTAIPRSCQTRLAALFDAPHAHRQRVADTF